MSQNRTDRQSCCVVSLRVEKYARCGATNRTKTSGRRAKAAPPGMLNIPSSCRRDQEMTSLKVVEDTTLPEVPVMVIV